MFEKANSMQEDWVVFLACIAINSINTSFYGPQKLSSCVTQFDAACQGIDEGGFCCFSLRVVQFISFAGFPLLLTNLAYRLKVIPIKLKTSESIPRHVMCDKEV